MFLNRQFLNSYLATAIASTAGIIILAPEIVLAKSPTEIAAVAEVVTVKIDNNLGVPGGSGVIIAKENNSYTVLTANHVVKNVNIGYLVKTPDNQEYKVTGVKNLRENGLDLASITFQSDREYSVATIGDSEYAVPGASIFVSGYPLTAEVDQERHWEFTTGTVTSIRETAAEGYSMRYQALTRRGMSGGGVFDTSGRLVGIHGQGDVIGSVRNESSSIPEPLKTGFNAAIPIKNFTEFLEVTGLSKNALNIDGGKPDREEGDIDVEATKNYVEGLELLAQGDVTRANDYLIEAADKNPNNVVAIYYQGLIDYTKRDLHAAIANYDRAIKNNPNFALAYFSRGLAQYRQGNRNQALEDYNSAIRLNPTDPWSYLNRGIVKEDLADLDGALEDYNRSIHIAPDYGKSYHNRGAVLYSRREFEAASADFKKASEIFFQQGDTNSYNVAIDGLNKAQKAFMNSQNK
ncbi:serine protease [Waterburya agarophytonicola K14]|uniref:Serine protease n=1 Tax=Waterburya agarophytonicola KI4 TaxID=2874699 RepID=A0A964FGG4_9CYAN|nr:tetratricopeptide repeat-containing serine protease family protein [Waterburya agarophytonicola]MCC0177986.1 serine protease [Waterburya agarophytonicola KI4]